MSSLFSSFNLQCALTLILIIPALIIGYKLVQKKKISNKLKKFEEESRSGNKVILHVSPESIPSIPHSSPYCAKIIAFFEHNNIPYSFDTTMYFHPYTQQMPWITYKHQHLTDSNLIIKWFEKESQINMNKHLNDEQQSDLVAYQSMIEDGLIWIIRYRRFAEYHNYKKFGPSILAIDSYKLIQKIILFIFWPKVQTILWTVGIARYKKDEVYKKGERIIKSIMTKIGDNKFFFGDKISTLDICIYSHIGPMYQFCSLFTWGNNKQIPSKLPLMNKVNDYMKRIETECFGKCKYWKHL